MSSAAWLRAVLTAQPEGPAESLRALMLAAKLDGGEFQQQLEVDC